MRMFETQRMNPMKMTRKVWLQGAMASLALAVTTGAMAQQPTELRVGLIPSEDAQAMIRASQQVMDQLATKTGMKVKPFVANDYNGVIEALRSGKLDIAYLGPFSYVLASEVAGAEAFAVAVTKKTGSSSYHSMIIARKDKGWDKIPPRFRPDQTVGEALDAPGGEEGDRDRGLLLHGVAEADAPRRRARLQARLNLLEGGGVEAGAEADQPAGEVSSSMPACSRIRRR